MNTPEISILIPLYNRRQYAEDCINSALNQTFQDFEIIIRDDESTDGVFEFVKNRYAKEISSGKIKLFRNEKNLGEAFTVSRLLRDATGKYLTILHNDDMYLPQALQRLYDVAEKNSADIVHCASFLTSARDGVIAEGTRLQKISRDKNTVAQVEIMSPNLDDRFFEWLDGGTFQDLQYNIFRREFITANEIFFHYACCESLLFTLIWLMRAKVFVKTPDALYIRRDSPYSQTNDANSAIYKFEKSIPLRLKLFRSLDKFISECDFLKGNDEFQYYAKTKIFITHESLNNAANIKRGNKNYVELYNSIEDTFRKLYGSDAIYFALLFHWAHHMHFHKNKTQSLLRELINTVDKEI